MAKLAQVSSQKKLSQRGKNKGWGGRKCETFSDFQTNLTPSHSVRPRNPNTQIQRQLPTSSCCSSQSQTLRCLEMMKCLSLYPLPITHAHSSVTTTTPQKNKISANHPGMIQGFRLKDEVNTMSDLWWARFLIHQQSCTEVVSVMLELRTHREIAKCWTFDLVLPYHYFDPAVLMYGTRSKY